MRISSLLFILMLPSLVFGQAWVRPAGGGYIQAGFSSITASSLYRNFTGRVNLNREVRDQTLSVYGEYGLTPRITLSADVPLKLLATGNDTTANGDFSTILPPGDLQALSNIRLNGRYGFAQKGPLVASAGLTLQLPTATFDEQTGLRSGVAAWGLSPNIHAGYGLSWFFASASAGFNWRSNDYSSQYFGQVQAGFNLFKQHLLLMAGLDVLQSLRNGSFDDGTGAQTGLYQDETSFVAWNFKLAVRPWDHIRIWVATGRGFGDFVARAPSYSVTLSWEWNKTGE